MTNFLVWLDSIFGSIPGLSWLEYVIAGVFILIVLDASLNLLFGALASLGGGKR